jgi:polysaccharide export outer membrane protein
MENMRFLGRWINGLGLLFVSMMLLGCQSGSPPDYDPFPQDTGVAPLSGVASNSPPADYSGTILRKGDAITVTFSDLVNPLAPLDKTIEDDGSVTLYWNQRFQADGKTIGALQTEIRERYVPAYLVNLTVSIKNQDRFFTVSGQVKNENRFVYTGYMSLTRAIATAGGFTDYARKSDIQVTRANGKTFTVDYNKALKDHKYDPEIYPNDQITVKHRTL